MTVKLHEEVNWFQRLVQRFAWSRVGMWVGSNYLHYFDRLAVRLTGGKTSLTSIIAGLPMVMLTTTGARTGLARTVPLVGLPDQERIILAASSWGREKHPGWYYNLIKNPIATVSTPGWRKVFTAHMADEEEAEVYWRKFIAVYPGYRLYREIARQRQIGLFILEPADGLAGPQE